MAWARAPGGADASSGAAGLVSVARIVDMRSFVCSALFIAIVLIGQQWVLKAGAAEAPPPATSWAAE